MSFFKSLIFLALSAFVVSCSNGKSDEQARIDDLDKIVANAFYSGIKVDMELKDVISHEVLQDGSLVETVTGSCKYVSSIDIGAVPIEKESILESLEILNQLFSVLESSDSVTAEGYCADEEALEDARYIIHRSKERLTEMLLLPEVSKPEIAN